MRRFIAYILASFMILLGVGVALKPTITRMNANLDFRNGKELTFRISERENSEDKIDEDSTKYYADVMESRLLAYGIDDYKIVTCGLDTIKVTLAKDNDEEYEKVAQLLYINPEIELCNLSKEGVKETEEQHVTDTDEYSWHDNKAYLTYNEAATVLVMPIPAKAKDHMQELLDAAKKYEEGGSDDKDNLKNANALNDDEGDTSPTNSIVLWMNRGEDDKYEDKEKNPDVMKKIIYDQLTSSNITLDDKECNIKINFNPTSGSVTGIRDAYENANLLLNLLNASEVKFDCSLIRQEMVPAMVENLLIYGSKVEIAMSATFIASIVGFILISLVLALIYRLNAISMVSTMSLTTFLTFLMLVVFKSPFSMAALVGLIIATLASLITPIMHHAYLQNEVYKGRNLKKANYEASKKTTWLTVDVSIISIIAGIIIYFVGGSSVASAGIVLIIFSVLNVIINTFIHKSLTWLLFNNSKFQIKNKYYLLNLKKDKVPDLSKGESQTYFGPFMNKDFSKKKKAGFIITLLMSLASVVGLITFSAFNKTFNTNQESHNEIMISIPGYAKEDVNRQYEDDYIITLLDKITNNGNKLSYGEISFYTYEYVDYTDVTNPLTLLRQNYSIMLNESDISSETYRYIDEVDADPQNLEDLLRETIISEQYFDIDNENDIRVTNNVTYNIPSNISYVFASSIISVLLASLYLFIRRYRLSEITTLLLTSAIPPIISIGFISLTRISATPIMSISSLIVSLVALFMNLFILNQHKNLIIENKSEDLSKAVKLALVPISSFILLAFVLMLNFLSFGSQTFIPIYLSAAFTIIISGISLITLFNPCASYLDKHFSRVKLPQIKLRKKHQTKKKDSNEPEEAIFIGIND